MTGIHQVLISGNSAPITATFKQTSEGTLSPSTVVTVTGANLGTASSERIIVVSVMGDFIAGTVISTVTIAGVSATLQKQQLQSGSFSTIWAALVPTGATGDIIATADASIRSGDHAIGVWEVHNLVSITASQTAGQGAGSGTITGTVTPTKTNNCIIAGAYSNGLTGSGFSWTVLTEASDYVTSGNDKGSDAGLVGAAASAQTPVITPGGNGDRLFAMCLWEV